MRQLSDKKNHVLMIGAMTVLVIVALTAGISTLEFRPGQSFYIAQPTQDRLPMSPVVGVLPEHFISVVVWAALILLGIAILLAILDPKQRKKLPGFLLRLALLTLLVSLIASRFEKRPVPTQEAAGADPQSFGEITAGLGEAPPPFSPPAPSSLAVYLVSFGLLLVIGGLAYWGYSTYKKKHVRTTTSELARIARATLKEIHGSDEWENAIINCYIRMSAVVSIRRSLSRQMAVTPSEFAAQLESAGLPREAVRRLTLLFERVRYGAKVTTRQEIDEAVGCLTAILQACGETP